MAPSLPAGEYGGTLIAASSGDPPNLDVARATSVQLLHMWGQSYSQLVRYNFQEPLEDVVPDLATGWEVSDGSTVYTFKIRQGVKWHDGQDFTVEDAQFGVQVLKDNNPRMIPELESVTAIETVGNDTLRITLNAPRASLVAVLGIIQAPIVAQHVWEAAAGDLAEGPTVGTGPFLAGEYVRGESADFSRFDGYYLEGKPYLDGIRYLMIGDESTRIAAFRTGRVDLLGPGVTDINKVQLAQLQGDVPDLSPNPYDRLSSKIVIINTEREPFTDVRVRRAIFLAIDRFEALEVLDDVTRPAGPAFAPGWELPEEELLAMPGYRQGADKQQDLDEAMRLLAEAGYPDGFDTEAVTVEPVARLVKLQVFVVDQLAKVGIRVKSSPLPFPELVPRAVSNDFDLFPVESSVLYIDPDANSYNISVQPFSNVHVDERTNELYAQQRAEQDPDKRLEIVYEMQRRMLETLGQIPIAWGQGFWPSQAKVKNFFPPKGVWLHAPRLDHVWLDE